VCPSEADRLAARRLGRSFAAAERSFDLNDAHDLERAQGLSGELVLRARGGHLEVISNGSFLISTENEASSRALVTAAGPWLSDGPLRILIGGLGLGYALDEALRLPSAETVTVAELEPVVVSWFERYGGERARRAGADHRASVVVADVMDVLQTASEAYDLICLDTDNGPQWLVREPNAALYGDGGIRAAFRALRPGGVAVFWSPERYPRFEAALAARFPLLRDVVAMDVVHGRSLEYVMYVAVKLCSRSGAPSDGAGDMSGERLP
jgi:spermidine synthase